MLALALGWALSAPYADAYTQRVASAVAEVVAEQVKAGLDVVTDGELGKVSFLTYVKDRLGGFDTASGERLMPPSWQVEIDAFPDYYAGYLGKYKDQVSPMTTMVCTGPVSYQGHAQLQTDIANLRAALAGHDVVEAFLPSTSPSGFGRYEYYPSYGEYLAGSLDSISCGWLSRPRTSVIVVTSGKSCVMRTSTTGSGEPSKCSAALSTS